MAEVDFPCHLSWDDLEGNSDTARFCASCKKTIHNKIPRNTGVYCGTDSGSEWPPTHKHFLRRFLVILLITFGSSLFTNFYGQTNTQDTTDSTKQEMMQSFGTLQGTITDSETGEPLPFVTIVITLEDEKKFSAVTDFDGKYKVQIPVTSTTKATVKWHYIGYKEAEFKAALIHQDKITFLNKALEPVEQLIIGIIITEPPQISSDPNAHRSTTFKREEVKRHPKRN